MSQFFPYRDGRLQVSGIAIERLAEQHGCSAILTNLRQVEAKGRSGWISDVLYERGHWIAGTQMCKRVAAAG